MANDMDMIRDIEELESNPETKQQSYDLSDLYFYRSLKAFYYCDSQ